MHGALVTNEMIKTGSYKNYYWIEILSDSYGMANLLTDLPELVIDKHLAIVSFDSGSFLPTEEELKRGWVYENEIAYFDKLNEYELSQDGLFDIYDQWLIFNDKRRFDSMDIYVNYSRFSVDFDRTKTDLEKGDTKRFWLDVEKIQPQEIILNGNLLTIITTDNLKIEKIKNLVISDL